MVTVYTMTVAISWKYPDTNMIFIIPEELATFANCSFMATSITFTTAWDRYYNCLWCAHSCVGKEIFTVVSDEKYVMLFVLFCLNISPGHMYICMYVCIYLCMYVWSWFCWFCIAKGIVYMDTYRIMQRCMWQLGQYLANCNVWMEKIVKRIHEMMLIDWTISLNYLYNIHYPLLKYYTLSGENQFYNEYMKIYYNLMQFFLVAETKRYIHLLQARPCLKGISPWARIGRHGLPPPPFVQGTHGNDISDVTIFQNGRHENLIWAISPVLIDK